MLANGGFRLNKWNSNSGEVISSISKLEWSKGALDFIDNELPLERALDLYCSAEFDLLKAHLFKAKLKSKVSTRRGDLSVTNSIFDPLRLGVVAILPIKALLRKLCRKNLGWDDPIPPSEKGVQIECIKQLPELGRFSLPRCYKPPDFGKIVYAHLNHFANARENAYEAVTFTKLINERGSLFSLIWQKQTSFNKAINYSEN